MFIVSISILIFGCKISQKTAGQQPSRISDANIEGLGSEPANKAHDDYFSRKREWISVDPFNKRGGRINGSSSVPNIDWISKYANANTEEIYLHVVDIDKIDFSPLFGLKNLHYLNITCYDSSFVDFPDLSGVKNLKELVIFGASIKSFQNMREKLPDIERLSITPEDSWGLKIEDFHNISKITSIRKIFLQIQSDMDIKLLDFHGLSNLEEFKTFTAGVIDFEGSENLPSLAYLEARYCTPKNVRYISNLILLRELELKIDKSISDLSFLTSLTNLKRLDLNNGNYNRGAGPREGLKDYQVRIDVQPLQCLINLERLSFAGFIIENILALADLPLAHQTLYACDCFFLPDDNIRRLSEGGIFLYRDYIPDGR